MIIYIYPKLLPFIEKDMQMFRKVYAIYHQELDWKNKLLIIVRFIQQIFFLLPLMKKANYIVIRLVGYWALVPVLLGKIFAVPVVVIPGGADSVSIPDYDFGSFRKKILSVVLKFVYQNASYIVTVDDSLLYSTNQYLQEGESLPQGILYFLPDLKTPCKVINNGFDPEKWTILKTQRGRYSFISIANVNTVQRFYIKGLDLIVETARRHAHCTFLVVGVDPSLNEHFGSIPGNLKVLPFVDPESLVSLLNTYQYYLHLARSEGFPNALCEAMLCGCIPIGSKVAAIPRIISEHGFLVSSSSQKVIDRTVREALTITPEECQQRMINGRQWIRKNYTESRRLTDFKKLLTALDT